MRTAIPALLTLLAFAAWSCGDEARPAPPREPAPRATSPSPAPAPEPAPADDGDDDDAAPRELDDPDAGFTASPLPVGKPMLLDFTRDHCLPCEIMAPWVAELRKEHGRLVEIVEINIDRPENKPLGRYFKARSIPTQVYVDRKGEQASRHVGLATKEQMQRTLKRLGFLDAREEAAGERGHGGGKRPGGRNGKKRK